MGSVEGEVGTEVVALHQKAFFFHSVEYDLCDVGEELASAGGIDGAGIGRPDELVAFERVNCHFHFVGFVSSIITGVVESGPGISPVAAPGTVVDGRVVSRDVTGAFIDVHQSHHNDAIVALVFQLLIIDVVFFFQIVFS